MITAQDSAVQDLTFPDAPVYTDYHEKHISVPSLRPGDVLEYRFIRTIVTSAHPRAVLDQLTTSRENGIVLDEQLEINVPKDRQIKLKTKPGYDAKITDEGDRPHLSLDAFPAEGRRRRQEEKQAEEGRRRAFPPSS